MSDMRKVVVPARVKAVGARQFETVITTGTVDRERDVIDPAGWKLANYMKGGAGPVLWAHDYSMPPIAKTLEIRRTATGLLSVDQFPPVGVYPFADTVHDLVQAGMIRAKSVGFIPLRKTWNAARDGWDINEAELLEHSYVSVPANPEALVVARSKGVRDRAQLAAFFGSPRGSDVVLALEDEPEILVDERDLRAALGEVVRTHVARAVRRASVEVVGVAEPTVLAVAEPGDAAVYCAVDPAEVGALLGRVVAEHVGRELHTQLLALTGKVD